MKNSSASSSTASDHPLGSDDDPDTLRSVASDIEYVGEPFGVGTDECTQSFYERAIELESERPGASRRRRE